MGYSLEAHIFVGLIVLAPLVIGGVIEFLRLIWRTA